MQVGFEYNYKDSSEIIASIEAISSFSVFEMSILAALLIFVCVGIYYLFPIIFLTKKYMDRQKEKAKRKIMLKQISMQRTIEDEIEAEIEETAKKNAEQ